MRTLRGILLTVILFGLFSQGADVALAANANQATPSGQSDQTQNQALQIAPFVQTPSNATSKIKLSAETDVRWVVGNADYRGAVIDANELGALAEISKGVRAKGLLAFQSLCTVDKSKAQCPFDWQRFMREAYLQFDLQDIVQKGPHVSVLVGRLEIESAPSDSALMIDNNAPMFSVTRVRTAYAVQVVIDTQKTKIVDEVSIAAINTGPNDPDIQADLAQKNVPGGMVRMTKTVLDRLTLTLGVTRLNYMPRAETRINANATYKITNEWKVFINTEETTYNPYYENSRYAGTVGLAFDNAKGTAGLELSRVDKQFTEVAVGYLWKLTPVIAAGIEARHDWCDRGANQCTKSNSRATFEVHYLYDAISDDQSVGVAPTHCAVGDPSGCVPEVAPNQNKSSR